MKNYERYADEIKGYKGNRFCTDFIVKHIVKTSDCITMDCDACRMLQMVWLLEDYKEPKEPEIDWDNVAVDTPILVRNYKDEKWKKRYFAKFEYGYDYIYAWLEGRTSWNENEMAPWKYAKLVENEEE